MNLLGNIHPTPRNVRQDLRALVKTAENTSNLEETPCFLEVNTFTQITIN